MLLPLLCFLKYILLVFYLYISCCYIFHFHFCTLFRYLISVWDVYICKERILSA